MIQLFFLVAALPWYEQKMEGWYYFQDKEKEESLSPEEAEAILSSERERLKELLSLAVLMPTEENVAHYIREQRRWMDQSSLFASKWIDVTGEPKGDDPFRAHAKRFFLLFCFNGKEASSIDAAKTAQIFASKHDWTLRGVTLDGEGLEGIESEKDRGISQRLSLSETPSLYLVDLRESRTILLGSGELSLNELEENILHQLRENSDE